MAWPKHYPKRCPPADSKEANGTVYRYVKDPSDPEEFKSYWFQKPHQRRDFEKRGKACQARGLTVYRSLQDLMHASKIYRKMKRGKAPTKADLSPEMGKIKQTPGPGNHYTWWTPTEFENPCEHFSLVE